MHSSWQSKNGDQTFLQAMASGCNGTGKKRADGDGELDPRRRASERCDGAIREPCVPQAFAAYRRIFTSNNP